VERKGGGTSGKKGRSEGRKENSLIPLYKKQGKWVRMIYHHAGKGLNFTQTEETGSFRRE